NLIACGTQYQAHVRISEPRLGVKTGLLSELRPGGHDLRIGAREHRRAWRMDDVVQECNARGDLLLDLLVLRFFDLLAGCDWVLLHQVLVVNLRQLRRHAPDGQRVDLLLGWSIEKAGTLWRRGAAGSGH